MGAPLRELPLISYRVSLISYTIIQLQQTQQRIHASRMQLLGTGKAYRRRYLLPDLLSAHFTKKVNSGILKKRSLLLTSAYQGFILGFILNL